MMKILYADDENKYRRLIKMFLENQGYEVLTAKDGNELLELFDGHQDCALIILDVMMPNLDGIETCKILRAMSDVPILMLTALGGVHDEVHGLRIGADDYIAKPFSNEKLVARVEALIRRTAEKEEKASAAEGFELRQALCQLVKDGKVIVLTSKEFMLFKVMITNKDQILSRDQLLNKVWGYGYEGDPRTLDTHIKSLRNKLGDYSDVIKTRRGQGYYFRSSQ